MKVGLFLVILFTYPFAVESYEKSDAFMVTILENRIKVLSPARHSSPQGIVLENKTLTKVVGKLLDDDQKTLKFLAIEPGEFKSVEVPVKKGGKVIFVPMAPSFQEVELIFGKKAYEVPPKK